MSVWRSVGTPLCTLLLALCALGAGAQQSELPAGHRPKRGPVYLFGSAAVRAELQDEIAPRSLQLTLTLLDEEPSLRCVMLPSIADGSTPGSAPEPAPREARAQAAWLKGLPARDLLIEFSGGEPRDWARALFPRGRATPLIKALWGAHSEGAAVLASARVAAVISGAAIEDPSQLAGETKPVDFRRQRAERERNPRKASANKLFWSLSFFPWALVEVEPDVDPKLRDPRGASFGRFIDTLHAERLRFGVFLPTGGALLGLAVKNQFRGLSEQAALVIDLRPARRSPGWLLDARLSELGRGDVWQGRTRQVSAPASALSASTESTELEAREGTLELTPALNPADALDPADELFGAATVDFALRALADSSAARVRIGTSERGFELEVDAQTSMVAGRFHQLRLSWWSPELGRAPR